MAKVKNVEKKIRDLERFNVVILSAEGRNIRDDLEGLPPYTFERAAKDDMTVIDWKATRFKSLYVGYEVDVLNGSGQSVHGATKLENVRVSY